jgi:hypothetical protein
MIGQFSFVNPPLKDMAMRPFGSSGSMKRRERPLDLGDRVDICGTQWSGSVVRWPSISPISPRARHVHR